jgi:hypothetical protein
MKTTLLVTALLILTSAATGATAQSNPYAACVAEAYRVLGPALSTDRLMEYMKENPSCVAAPKPVPLPPIVDPREGSRVYLPPSQWDTAAVFRYEPGGLIQKHWERFIRMAQRNEKVELRGPCYSACTLVVSAVKRHNICFGPNAALHFHQASRGGSGPDADQPVYETTAKMVASYPSDIRAWIERKGGAARMPHESFWSLSAAELWAMGYQRCD